MTSDEQLKRLARAIADGLAVDWAGELADVAPEHQSMVESLRELALLGRPAASCDAPDASEAVDSADTAQVWGPFLLHEPLGRGSSGTVYRAHDSNLDREVALKLRVAGEGSGEFLREGRLLARLRHPNIVCVYGAETHSGRDGVWMELIRGRTYHRIVASEGPLSAREAALVGVDVCNALAAVHAAGLIHRDVTAKNVMREVGGRVVLLDFSAGRHRAIDDVAIDITGTPSYLAPEILSAGGHAGTQGDVYSVGVLLWHLVTGTYPFEARTLSELRAAHAAGRRLALTDARIDLSEAFVAVIEGALSPVPSARPTATEIAKALAVTSTVVQVEGTAPRPTAVRGEGRRWWSKPLPAWVVAILVIASVSLSFWLMRRWPALPGAAPSAATPQPTNEYGAVLLGYLELADESADAGDWTQAISLYERAAALLEPIVGLDGPVRALVLANKAWALTSAGRSAAAHEWFDLSLYKLAQELGPVHPIRSAIELARAEAFVREGRLVDAESAIGRAVLNHRQMLASIGIGLAAEPLRLPANSLVLPLCADVDGDWILDAFERMIGSNPNDPDSDGDGTRDDEEDSDGDGVVNGVAWPSDCDPRRTLGHYGNIDPLRVGFRQERRFSGAVAPKGQSGYPAWRVDSDPMGFYFAKLTKAQKKAALTRGWRLRARMALWAGNGFVNLDLVPYSARFDLNLFVQPPDTASLLLMTSSMPRAGEWIGQGRVGALPLVEFVFEPTSATVRLLVDGRTVRARHAGYRQYQEDFGLFFGTTDDVGAADRGSADFALAWLSIR